jgi:hypothetical protein
VWAELRKSALGSQLKSNIKIPICRSRKLPCAGFVTKRNFFLRHIFLVLHFYIFFRCAAPGTSVTLALLKTVFFSEVFECEILMPTESSPENKLLCEKKGSQSVELGS